jgi:hypothetical protein
MLGSNPVPEFIDPDWGDKVELRHRVVVRAHRATWAGGPVRQPNAGGDFISPVRVYEFGYRTVGNFGIGSQMF